MNEGLLFALVAAVFALLYGSDETPGRGVRETGEKWDDGELVAFAFESDEEALEAQA